MTIAAQIAPALYPPAVTPPAEPLRLRQFVFRVLRNPLLSLPRAAYEQPIVALRAGRSNVFWVSGPELIEEILVRRAADFMKTPVEKRVFRRTLKDGVISADGALWRWQRRTMAPLFRPAEMRNYAPAMAAAAGETIARWRASPQGSIQPIDADMVETTFSVIVRTMLKGGAPAEAAVIKRATALSLAHVSWEIVYGALRLPLWLPNPMSWTLSRAARRLRGAVHDIIARRQAEGGEGGDLLGRLLAARDPETGRPMTMEQLINNLLSLLEAGHETTSRALTWTLYLLARAPEWQERLRAEAFDVLGPDGETDPARIEALALTQQVLKESMRLYPPVPVMSRIAARPAALGGVDIPEGGVTVIPIYCVHRHKALWEDPARFDPARFTPEREAAYPRTQFMPFGAGPRVCLGASFAMTEAAVILAAFLRAARFDWDGRHAPEPVSRLTLQPRGGMPLKVSMLG